MKKLQIISVLMLLVIALVHCSKDDVNVIAPATVANLQALPPTVSTPANNPRSAQKIASGKMLFWDPILSGNKDVACASCHHPSSGYG